jgi:hypothetical protein
MDSEKGEWALGVGVRDWPTAESYIAAAARNSLPGGDISDTPLGSLWLVEATNSWKRTEPLFYENSFIANREPFGEYGLEWTSQPNGLASEPAGATGRTQIPWEG